MSDDTYYEALGATPDASRDELRAAYRERISELEAAREGKHVNEAQLQRNREEVARVRAAWNVLSDPFQRKRYDEQLTAQSNGQGGDGGEVEIVDDEASSKPSDVPLTGWRRILAPPPRPAAGTGNGKPPPRRRPVREPTIPLPSGMRLAEPRARGMALLFDFAVVLAVYWLALLVVPGLVNSDYQTKLDNSTRFSKMHDAQVDIDDANKNIDKANAAIAKAENGNSSSLQSAQDDLQSAQSDKKDAEKKFNDQAKDARKDGYATPHDAKALEKQADDLSSDVRGPQYVAYLVVLIVALAYLVPATALTGRTLGMRGRKIRVVRIDGSPVGWYGAFTRFVIPILVALAIPTLGPIIGLGMVLWGYRDPNGQGIHDKLARTLVVADGR
jgi:uncharacterized RDD family membrane protein YckC